MSRVNSFLGFPQMQKSMNEKVKHILAYKAKQDLTLEDVAILKADAESEIEKIVRDLESLTGTKISLYNGLRDDLGNASIDILLNL